MLIPLNAANPGRCPADASAGPKISLSCSITSTRICRVRSTRGEYLRYMQPGSAERPQCADRAQSSPRLQFAPSQACERSGVGRTMNAQDYGPPGWPKAGLQRLDVATVETARRAAAPDPGMRRACRRGCCLQQPDPRRGDGGTNTATNAATDSHSTTHAHSHNDPSLPDADHVPANGHSVSDTGLQPRNRGPGREGGPVGRSHPGDYSERWWRDGDGSDF